MKIFVFKRKCTLIERSLLICNSSLEFFFLRFSVCNHSRNIESEITTYVKFTVVHCVLATEEVELTYDYISSFMFYSPSDKECLYLILSHVFPSQI